MNDKTKKRKTGLIIVLSIIGVVVIVGAAIILTILHANTPTKGASISQYGNPKSALVVLDIQNDITSIYGDTAEFVDKVNRAITIARGSEMEIIYIKSEYGDNPIIPLLNGGRFKKGTYGAELDGRLDIVNGNIFSKLISDSFSSKDFEEYLMSQKIDTLYIVGADAAACVHKTALGGINRKYQVNIIKDAIITSNDAVMQQMLNQYVIDGIIVIDLTKFAEIMGNFIPF
jgi:nicotinamidase-related amidase